MAMLSILTGVISEGMMERANDRKADMRFLEERKKIKFVESLTNYFVESDADNDGTIHREEFNAALPTLTKMFKDNDFAYGSDDLSLVFDLIDYDRGNTIELNEFLEGVASFTANPGDLPMHVLRLQCNMNQ